MSDGPFKNLKLPRRWKLFAEAAQNDTFDRSYCCALASHALLTDMLNEKVKAVLADLQEHATREALTLSSLDELFGRHSKTPFTDILQKELAFRVCEQIATSEAIKEAISAAVLEQALEANNRIVEECIVSREFGTMWQEEFNLTVSQSSSILRALPITQICQALLVGDKNYFKDAVAKRVGLEDGPSL